MSHHTAGPWRVGDAGKTVFGPPNGKPYPEVIADVRGGNIVRGHLDNARLIAAAPEMLEALQAIVFQVCQGKVLERDACITQARAAIAKAEKVSA